MTAITFNNTNLSDYLTKMDVGVDGAYILITKGDDKKLKNNYGNGNKENIIIGSPVISSYKAKFLGNTNYIETSFKDSDALTIFSIAKRPNASEQTDAAAFSNHVGAAAIGFGLYWYRNGNVSFGATRLNSSGVATSAQISLPNLANDQWAFVCAETSSLDANKLTNLATGESVTSPLKTDRVVYESNKFRLGSSYSSAFSGEIDQFITVAFNKILSPEEKEVVVKTIRKFAESNGISV